MKTIGWIAAILPWIVLGARGTCGAEPPAASTATIAPTTPTRSLGEDVAKVLRQRIAEYQPLVEQLRKRSGEEIQRLAQWEYTVVTAQTADPEELAKTLNQWGQQGWECFHVVSAAPAAAGQLPGQHLVFFRKPRGSWLSHIPVRDLFRALLYLWVQTGDTDATTRPPGP